MLENIVATPSRSVADSARLSPRRARNAAGLDGRRRAAKRLRAITDDMAKQLPAPMTDAMGMLVKRAAELALGAELARGALLRGEAVDVLALVRLENLAARALKDLRARAAAVKPAIGPNSLREYAASKYAGTP